MGLTVYGGGGKPEEEKTVTAGTSAIVVNPSSGKVMKKVTVNPTPTEEKTITAGTSATTVTSTSGKYIKKVTVNPTPSQSKTVTPSTLQQTVSPDSGKLLSKVIVKAMEDVTPEVTAQTPVINQIAENLGVTITTPSGTNKQILQGNNANLLNIKNNAKKEGAYVWKKLTAQGGDFVDFVVSDNESAYPDGGTQGGYWYEKVVEGIDLSALGWTKCAIDYITPSTNIYIKNSPLRHSLGIAPKYIHIKALSTVTTTSYDLILLEFVGCYSTDGSFHGGKMLCRNTNGSNQFSPIFSSDSEKIVISDTYLMQGIQYQIITIG